VNRMTGFGTVLRLRRYDLHCGIAGTTTLESPSRSPRRDGLPTSAGFFFAKPGMRPLKGFGGAL
jgi:hypothetical protein